MEALDQRLRAEATAYKRAIPPRALSRLSRRLKALAKPLAQSGAMALTALVVIVAISATPAARFGDLVTPRSTPLAAPDQSAVIESDLSFVDYLPPGDSLAIRYADNHDIVDLAAE